MRGQQTQNLLAVSADATKLFVGWGAKLKIYAISSADKWGLDHANTIRTIPGSKLRGLATISSAKNNTSSTELLATISNLGTCVFQIDHMERPPLIFGLGTPHCCMTSNGSLLAVANESNEVSVWDLEKELQKKNSSEQTVLLDYPIVDLAFVGEDSSKLLVLCADGNLRVYSLGLSRMCVAAQALYPANTFVSCLLRFGLPQSTKTSAISVSQRYYPFRPSHSR